MLIAQHQPIEIAMSELHIPAPPPIEVDNITSHAPELISYEYFKKACYAWGHWQIAMGTPVAELQNPETFVTEADFDRFQNVVSNWPRAAAQRPPTLLLMVSALRTYAGSAPTSFGALLDTIHARILDWMQNNGVDPARPNESKEEKAARLNRERVRNYRLRHKQASSDDPEEAALAEAVRTAAKNVHDGKAWQRGREKDHKLLRDKLISDARSACAAAIRADTDHVTEAEKQLIAAQTALDIYRINK